MLLSSYARRDEAQNIELMLERTSRRRSLHCAALDK
jgi:hypothetical protein